MSRRLRAEAARMPATTWFLVVVAMVSAFVTAAPLSAQIPGAPSQPGHTVGPGGVSSALPKALQDIGFDQKLGNQVPLDARFTDDAGTGVRFGDYFGARPVVLMMAYYNCPMLCPMALNGLAESLRMLSLEAGRDFDVAVVSIDPREEPPLAAERKAVFLKRYERPDATSAVHFLTGEQTSIARVAGAVGFRYAWDEVTKQFAHPTGVIVVTPEGRVSRYLFGVDYGPRDLRLALVEASAGRIGTPVDALLLYCYHYDPQTGRYGFAVMAAVRILGAVTVLAIGAYIFVTVRKEKRSGANAPGV
jgi:protein SCO1